ncbi:MAG: PEGA domain-containing protein [Candidatus Binataceae bacterium]
MVSSDPSGANVSINGQKEGTTPYVTTVPSSKDLQIEVNKPGYQTATINDDVDFRWGYEIWSFIEWIIPMGVDMADGAAWGHQQTMVATHLEPLTTATAPATDAASANTSQSNATAAPAIPRESTAAAANP